MSTLIRMIGTGASIVFFAMGWVNDAESAPASGSTGLIKAQYDGADEPGPGPYGGPGGAYAPQHGKSRSRENLLSYHGFELDLAAGGDSTIASNAVASAEHQVDIVDQVGLSASNLRLFHSLPIRISGRLFGGGHFSGGHEVEIGGAAVTDNRPILLHEYMHAYHFFKLPGRFKNPDILRFYDDATSQGLYESGSYMMSNPAEFFAVTASCYLWGTVAREPYNRDTIRGKQPDYYAFLGRLFGRVSADAMPRPGGSL